MGKSIDTIARQKAVRDSVEVAAAKHLARAYGVALQRRPRSGPVVFNVGFTGKDHIAADYGTITFDDDGAIEDVRLFGESQGRLSLLELKDLLEHGPRPPQKPSGEEVTSLVLDEVPEAPVSLLTGAIVLPEVALQGTILEEPAAPVTARVVSIPVPAIGVTQPIPVATGAAVLADLQERALREVHTAASTWERFTLGMVLMVQVALLPILGAAGHVIPLAVVFLAVALALCGLVIALVAIHDNDRRLERLREVGLK